MFLTKIQTKGNNESVFSNT